MIPPNRPVLADEGRSSARAHPVPSVDAAPGSANLLDFLQSAVLEAMKRRTPDEALRTGLAQVGADVGWPFGHLWVRDPSNPHTLISSGLFHPADSDRFAAFRRVTEASWFPSGTGLPGRVFAEGRAIWLADLSERPDFTRRESALATGLNTGFAFPVRVDDQVVAIVELFTTEVLEANTALLDIVERMGSHLGGLVDEAWARQGGISTHSSDFYLALLEHFPFLVWRGGPDGRRSYFNRTWFDFTGRSEAEEMDYGWIEGVHPDDRSRVVRTCSEAAAAGDPFTLDYRLRRHDGQTRWMNDVARPFKGGHGESFGYIGSCYDVTTRYGVLEDLQNHRERLHLLSRRLMKVQESEQRRIARGLHDEIGQLLASARMGLHGLEAKTPGFECQGAEIARSIGILDRCIESVRTLAHDLRPPDLDVLGLAPAMRIYLDRQASTSGIPVRFNIEGVPDSLPEATGTALFRVIQEAVTNAVRHSRASSIEVSIRRRPGWLEARVEDDGRGFDPATRGSAARGAGLVGMEERIALMNGRLTIESAPGRGTRVKAEFPLEEGHDDE